MQGYFASLAARQADYERAKLDYERRAKLGNSGAVSGDELSAAKNNFEAAAAALDGAKALTSGVDVMTHPEVLAAKTALDVAKLNLDRTVIRAPVDGVVAQLQVQFGQRVQAGAPVMTIVPIADVYVDANFTEDQLGEVRPGQSATLTSDFYGSSVTFHGVVAGVGGGTGVGLRRDPGAERDRQLDQGRSARAGAHHARSRRTEGPPAARRPVDVGRHRTVEVSGRRAS